MAASTESNYIIFDLEWNYVHDRKQKLSEIIDIGAAKVARVAEQLTVVDTFQAYVKPTFSPHLAKEIRRITQVSADDLSQESPFPHVLEQFVRWIGDSDSFLCSWGPDQFVLIENCRLHDLDIDWLKNFNDIQSEFMRAFSYPLGQQVGLMSALEMFQIPFEGRPHRAVDDAANTARLFIKVFDQLRLERNVLQPEELLNYGIPEKGYDERIKSFDGEYVRCVQTLKNHRVYVQLKRKDLAALCGMSKKSIANIEGFRRKASLFELQAIKKALQKINPRLSVPMPPATAPTKEDPE